ncbi:hypothetical protein Pmani_027736 [Petrolisthes manimaculis]|uniref:Uncharacterized protein n=1 Tax=Petrolisthes manimaculis TaxID=1843537 RepID=A0AAE1TYR2_9EUCA|nr:hypothetical protein Pmani_027736 [Petrolisthes manimaculis]
MAVISDLDTIFPPYHRKQSIKPDVRSIWSTTDENMATTDENMATNIHSTGSQRSRIWPTTDDNMATDVHSTRSQRYATQGSRERGRCRQLTHILTKAPQKDLIASWIKVDLRGGVVVVGGEGGVVGVKEEVVEI